MRRLPVKFGLCAARRDSESIFSKTRHHESFFELILEESFFVVSDVIATQLARR
jgi:hypothetical protein